MFKGFYLFWLKRFETGKNTWKGSTCIYIIDRYTLLWAHLHTYCTCIPGPYTFTQVWLHTCMWMRSCTQTWTPTCTPDPTQLLYPDTYNMYACIPAYSFADIDTYAHKCMHTYCKILLTGLCNSYVYTHTHTDVNRLNSRVTRSLLPWARLSERMKRFLKKTLKFKCFLRYYSVE